MAEIVSGTMGTNALGMGTTTAAPVSYSYLQPSVPDDEEPMPPGWNGEIERVGVGDDISPYGISVPPPLGTTVSDDEIDAPLPLEMTDGAGDALAASESDTDRDFDCCECLENFCEAAQAILECIQYMSD